MVLYTNPSSWRISSYLETVKWCHLYHWTIPFYSILGLTILSHCHNLSPDVGSSSDPNNWTTLRLKWSVMIKLWLVHIMAYDWFWMVLVENASPIYSGGDHQPETGDFSQATRVNLNHYQPLPAILSKFIKHYQTVINHYHALTTINND